MIRFRHLLQVWIFFLLFLLFTIVVARADIRQERPDVRPLADKEIVRISGIWGEQRSVEGYVHFHTGIDFAAYFGTQVKAVADGEVSFAGELNGYGWTIILKHKFIQQQAQYDGEKWVLVDVPYVVYSVYGHLSKQFVLEGQQGIRKGQVIGAVGTTGRTTGSHLHYELRNGSQRPIFNGTFQRRDGIERGVKFDVMTKEEIAFQKLKGIY